MNPAEKVTCEEESLSVLLTQKLSIPPYQRPYKWQEKHVIRLLEDTYDSYQRNKECRYRIGSIILHQEKEGDPVDIVDGQQRLVTISIILYYLNGKTLGDSDLLTAKFPNEISATNIVTNYRAIMDWFSSWTAQEKAAFRLYLLDKCNVVTIRLKKLAEAFQLFDAQNARGKSLEPHDLLKAYHLREMEHHQPAERLACVKRWEADVNAGKMVILGKYLYRIRSWVRGEDPNVFSKEDIDEFKGVNLRKHKHYPYLKSTLLNDALVTTMEGHLQMPYPFQLTQQIVDGKRFFEYVAYYIEQYADLFKLDDTDYSIFYWQFCRNYDGASRRLGDVFIREMYEALVLLYRDKFGNTEFDEVRNVLYKWSYIPRVELSNVQYNSINKYIRERTNAFKIIYQAPHPVVVRKMKIVLKRIERRIDPMIILFEAKTPA